MGLPPHGSVTSEGPPKAEPANLVSLTQSSQFILSLKVFLVKLVII